MPDGLRQLVFLGQTRAHRAAHLVREVTERLDFSGAELRPFDEADASEVARWFRERASTASASASCTRTPNGDHERRMRDVLRRVHPDAAVSISSRRAARVPRVRAGGDDAGRRVRQAAVARYVAQIEARLADAEVGPRRAVLRDEVERRRAQRREVRAAADHDPPERPGGGCARRGAPGAGGRLRPGPDLDGGGTSPTSRWSTMAPEPDHRGRVGRFPVKVPMIDIVTVGAGGGSIARLAPDGRLRSGPTARAPIRGRCATAAAAPSRPSPTRRWCSAASRRTCWAARSRSTLAAGATPG